MSEEQKKAKRPQRQDWKPNVIALLLHKAWMVVFGAAKIALGAAATVAIILAICLLAFASALGDYLTDDIMPQAGMNLDDFTLDQTSFVYYFDSDGEIKLLQQIHTSIDRQWADYEDIPEDMINAAIAIEDKRFYEHQGVDWFTTIKAFANMFLGDDSKGGSTITQQLIKNLTTDDSVTVQRKLLEIFRATQFEQRYDKDIVMEWYLNYIYLGRGCYGVRSAAERYFGKELEMLTTAECASLISITNNPSIFDPYGDEWEWSFYDDEEPTLMSGAERNNVRKEWTLGEMVTQGLITREEYEEAMAQELVFKSGIADEDRLTTCTNEACGYENIASAFTNDNGTYYCPNCGSEVTVQNDASQEIYSWFVDTALEDVAKALCERDGLEWTTGNGGTRTTYMDLIARSGYHIYTTLDMDVQNQVDLVYENTEIDTRSGQELSSAMVVINNTNGHIVAIAGDLGEKTYHDQLNIATDSVLQTGSSIKPLTAYGPAFEAGLITPASVVFDMPIRYDGSNPWPNNWNYEFSYSRSVLHAVRDSVNTCAINVVDMAGIDYSFEFARDELGLTSMIDYYVTSDGDVLTDRNLAALGLGGFNYGVTVREMASAFATFANEGVFREGITFTKVYDSEGNLVMDNEQESRQVFSEKTVDYMNYCLTTAVSSGTGTAARWSGWNGYVSGKTGSTESYKDLYFCGYTTHYTAAVWSGYKTPEAINVITSGFSNPSATLFRMVMEPLHEGLEPERTYDASKLVNVTICLDSGKLATEACQADMRQEYDYNSGFTRVNTVGVYREDRPTEYCDKHVMVEYCVEGEGVATEWCHHFAEAEEIPEAERITLEERSLTKMTREELEEMAKLEDYGLWEEFLEEGWVYLVDERGRDDNSYKGFLRNSKVNEDLEEGAPCAVCPVHTKEAWEEYQASLTPEPDPNAPTDPGAPTDPTAPTDPASGASGPAAG